MVVRSVGGFKDEYESLGRTEWCFESEGLLHLVS